MHIVCKVIEHFAGDRLLSSSYVTLFPGLVSRKRRTSQSVLQVQRRQRTYRSVTTYAAANTLDVVRILLQNVSSSEGCSPPCHYRQPLARLSACPPAHPSALPQPSALSDETSPLRQLSAQVDMKAITIRLRAGCGAYRQERSTRRRDGKMFGYMASSAA